MWPPSLHLRRSFIVNFTRFSLRSRDRRGPSFSTLSNLTSTTRRPRNHISFSTKSTSPFITSTFYPSPPLLLGTGRIATLTESSVVGTCGNTVVLAAVSADHESADQFLTVEYRQRAAAVGVFPRQNSRRTDNGRPTDSEVLCGRAIDRALRPLLLPYHEEHGTVAHYHVSVTVQATERGTSAAVAAALNTAAAAVSEALIEPVAATMLTLLRDGSVVQQGAGDNIDDGVAIVGELLYAGTRDRVVMIEWTSRIALPLPEEEMNRLLELAHASIQPTLDTIEELHAMRQSKSLFDDKARTQLRESLGLPPLAEQTGEVADGEQETKDESCVADANKGDAGESTFASFLESDDSSTKDVSKPTTAIELMKYRENILQDVVKSARETLGSSLHRLFGYTDDGSVKDEAISPVFVHGSDELPLSKRFRGQREQVMQEEIIRVVDHYLETAGIHFSTTKNDGDQEDQMKDQRDEDISVLQLGDRDRAWIHNQTVYKLLRRALWETTTMYGTRSDTRSGNTLGQAWKTIRPLALTVPALPDSVHGSATFARGDTQVLCTATLGAPSDGPTMSDPFVSPVDQVSTEEVVDESELLPVGSLRFLRTQEALESDLNSRKVKADRERIGDSGSLAESKRAFLQYDFPAYSTGVISKRKGGIDRRAIGHGSLAERAILPILPDPEAFPYAIRMTSEVTDSNGSSSMASVCGATLALLDAGVPIKDRVAGVSVGLAVKHDEIGDGEAESDEFSLLLDITGTEDHVAGTRDGVTAIQLDVKRPLPQQVLFDALQLASLGRAEILDAMDEQTRQVFKGSVRRHEPKPSAPRVEVVRFDPQRKRDLVGPGGVVLRQLEDRYGVVIDLTQEGKCLLFGNSRELVEKARTTVMDLVADVVEGEVYTGTVIDIKDYGAIVELLRNKEGLLHASELSLDNLEMKQHPEGVAGFVNKELQIGEKIEVLCIGVDVVQGSVRLSRKALLNRKQQHAA